MAISMQAGYGYVVPYLALSRPASPCIYLLSASKLVLPSALTLVISHKLEKRHVRPSKTNFASINLVSLTRVALYLTVAVAFLDR
jgi:hypothetical protein